MADEDEKTEFNLAEDPSFKKLVETMGTLGTMVKHGQESNAGLSKQIEALTGSITKGQQKAPDPAPDEDEVDDMTNSQLVATILKSVEGVMEKKIGGLTEDMKTFKSEVDSNSAKTSVEKFAENHKDVYDWSDEIKKVFQETPGISINNAYKLARMDDPDKVKEMDEKYSGEPEKKDEKKVFGGLTPTSRVTASGDEAPEDEKKMDVNEAANLAWDQALEEFPALGNSE